MGTYIVPEINYFSKSKLTNCIKNSVPGCCRFQVFSLQSSTVPGYNHVLAVLTKRIVNYVENLA